MATYKLRKQLIAYAHRIDAKGFVANHDGNLSARLPAEGRFLATPTARAKFDLKESDLITVDLAGKTRAGTGKVFSEWAQHVEIYKARPDVTAVVHAHCPEASAYGLGGDPLPVDFWPEGVVSLGRLVPTVPIGGGLTGAARSASACLVAGNGVFAWGANPEQAYLRLELVEHLVKIFLAARAAGTLRQLPTEMISVLMDKRKKAGLLSPQETFLQ